MNAFVFMVHLIRDGLYLLNDVSSIGGGYQNVALHQEHPDYVEIMQIEKELGSIATSPASVKCKKKYPTNTGEQGVI